MLAIRLTISCALATAFVTPSIGQSAKQLTLSNQTRDQILRWIVDLDADDYRCRVAAQAEIEKLAGEQLEFAKLNLKEKLSLEYMTRRRCILKRFELTGQLEKVEQEIHRIAETGKSELHGLTAFVRIVGSGGTSPQTFYEMHRARKLFLVTVYAAPNYAHDAVLHEIQKTVDVGMLADRRTDEAATRWISIFLTLCDRHVQLDQKKANRELTALAGPCAASIALGMADRTHGNALRSLVRQFIATGGERGDDFAKTERAALAKRFAPLLGK